MKKLIFIISLLVTAYVNGQTGVFIPNPQGTLHIDPKKDTNGSANIQDDFIINSTTGNVGLGIIPSTTEKTID